MSTLVGYGSSDEEDASVGHTNETSDSLEASIDLRQRHLPATNGTSKHGDDSPPSLQDGSSPYPPKPPSELIQSAPVGPTAPSALFSSLPPYTSVRSTIQQLTLPSHPNLSIPPSPPISPPPGLDSKISHFLHLKRKGIHFNEKLAKSSALKNPSLLPKLLESAGLDGEGGRDQYSSTLPTEIWDPHGFPEGVYKEGLAKMQQQVTKRKESERRGMEREFVPSNAGRVDVGVGLKGGSKESAAERIMVGLERKGQKETERSAKRRKG